MRALALAAAAFAIAGGAWAETKKITDAEVTDLLRAYATPAQSDPTLLEASDPMTQAMLHPDVAAVEKLLEKPGALDAPNGMGMTPLMTAANTRRVRIVRLLLERGADVHARTPGGSTALLFASQRGSAPIVRALLDQGAEIDAANDDGVTPLFASVLQQRYAAVETLLENGADPNARTREGVQPLDVARSHKNEALAALLERYGARAAGESDLLVTVT